MPRAPADSIGISTSRSAYEASVENEVRRGGPAGIGRELSHLRPGPPHLGSRKAQESRQNHEDGQCAGSQHRQHGAASCEGPEEKRENQCRQVVDLGPEVRETQLAELAQPRKDLLDDLMRADHQHRGQAGWAKKI